MGKKEIFDKFYLTYSYPLFKYYEMYYSESMKKSRIGAIIVLVSALCFSCALGDETAATVNFWDFKNAAVKDWKDNPASFLPVDFSDTELTADLIETYGTGSRFARLSERKAETPKLLFGDPEDDYFGNQYYYKYYTAEKPLESALGTWTGSVLYVVYSVANPIVEMVSAGSGINTIYCVFMAVAERDNKATPGKIEIRVDMDCMTKIILAGYSYFYPRLKEGKEIQRVYAANLEGMYMTGFDVAFSNKDSAAGSGSVESGSTESGSTESGSTESGSTESGSTESGSTESGSTENGSTENGSIGNEGDSGNSQGSDGTGGGTGIGGGIEDFLPDGVDINDWLPKEADS